MRFQYSSEAEAILQESITRCGLTQPANKMLKDNPVLKDVLYRFAIHISPYIENPIDGRPLLDTAIESAVTSYYTTSLSSEEHAQHAFIDALLTRATMLVDYEIRYYKKTWDPFGSTPLYEFFTENPTSHVTYGAKRLSFIINEYRQHILRIITCPQDIDRLGIPIETLAGSPEYSP